jgi:hypothetical protein
MTETQIAPARLAELRAEGRAKVGRFVDPAVLLRCRKVLARRGETWAAEVLGRDLTRRSLLVPGLPYLVDGEEHTLVDADREEYEARFAQIIAAEIQPPTDPADNVGD